MNKFKRTLAVVRLLVTGMIHPVGEIMDPKENCIYRVQLNGVKCLKNGVVALWSHLKFDIMDYINDGPYIVSDREVK